MSRLLAFKRAVMQRSRTRKLDEFYALLDGPVPVLDVGVTDNDHSPQVNMFLKAFRFSDALYTGLAVEPMRNVTAQHPGKRFVEYDGSRFPFEDRSFGAAFSNAVIEHVGNREAQVAFVNEMLRTCEVVYLTTPNQYFPVEAHTNTLFLHWHPPSFYAWCRRFHPYWHPDNLLLLNARTLAEVLARSDARWSITRANRLAGMTMTFSVVCSRHRPPMPGAVLHRQASA